MANERGFQRPMTVLFVDHTAQLSGGEIALLALVTALDPARCCPVVVLASDGPLVGRLQEAGVETHILPLDLSVVQTRKDTLGWRGLADLRRIGQTVRYAIHLARFARRRGADILHTNSLKADLYGGLAGHLARCPVVWHVRDHIGPPYLPRPAAAAFHLAMRLLPGAVITNSQSTLRRLHPTKRQKTAVAYSGVSDAALTLSLVAKGQPPTISLIGRLAPWKGQHVFLEAAAAIRAHSPEARYWIVGAPLFGEEPYERRLREQVRELGLEDRVTFFGFRNDIPALLAQTDVLVHASIEDEPFGQVVVQAMAAGKPVVATDGGGIPEIVRPGETGLLVPKGDAEALADAVCRLLSEPSYARALGEAGQRRVRERFTISQTARVVEEVYAALCSHHTLDPPRTFRQK